MCPPLLAQGRYILRAAKNDTNPKRKRGPQLVPSLALRVSMKRLISALANSKFRSTSAEDRPIGDDYTHNIMILCTGIFSRRTAKSGVRSIFRRERMKFTILARQHGPDPFALDFAVLLVFSPRFLARVTRSARMRACAVKAACCNARFLAVFEPWPHSRQRFRILSPARSDSQEFRACAFLAGYVSIRFCPWRGLAQPESWFPKMDRVLKERIDVRHGDEASDPCGRSDRVCKTKRGIARRGDRCDRSEYCTPVR